MSGLEQLGEETGVPLTVRGPGPIFWLDLDQPPASVPIFDMAFNESPAYERFRHRLLARGVRVMPGGAWYLSVSHDAHDVEITLETVRTVLNDIVGARRTAS